jgi:plasmid stabilization system protein ParE
MVRWSAPARNDLRQIYDYIARDSRYYARVVIDKIVTSTEKLERFPDIGRVVPEIGDDKGEPMIPMQPLRPLRLCVRRVSRQAAKCAKGQDR